MSRGLIRRRPALDVIRVQDIPDVAGQDDAAVLFWETSTNRFLLTRDCPQERLRANRHTGDLTNRYDLARPDIPQGLQDRVAKGVRSSSWLVRDRIDTIEIFRPAKAC